MKMATTINTFRLFTSTSTEAVQAFEGTGFQYLDYSFYRILTNEKDPLMGENWKAAVLETKETAERLGFTFVQAHGPYCTTAKADMERNLLGVKRSVEACSMLGIKNMVIHAGNFRDRPCDGDLEMFCEANAPFFRALIPAMEEFGVNILFENNGVCYGNTRFMKTGKDLNDFVQWMDHPMFGAAWDVGHAHNDGLDQYTEIMALGKNLKALHIDDTDGKRDLHTAPFLGTLNYDSLMRGLIDSGYAGYFTFESDYFFRWDRINGEENDLLAHPPLSIKRESVSLLYQIGKYMLEQYGLFEK